MRVLDHQRIPKLQNFFLRASPVFGAQRRIKTEDGPVRFCHVLDRLAFAQKFGIADERIIFPKRKSFGLQSIIHQFECIRRHRGFDDNRLESAVV